MVDTSNTEIAKARLGYFLWRINVFISYRN